MTPESVAPNPRRIIGWMLPVFMLLAGMAAVSLDAADPDVLVIYPAYGDNDPDPARPIIGGQLRMQDEIGSSR